MKIQINEIDLKQLIAAINYPFRSDYFDSTATSFTQMRSERIKLDESEVSRSFLFQQCGSILLEMPCEFDIEAHGN